MNEEDAIRSQAEAFIEGLTPLLAYWNERLSSVGVSVSHRLLVGPYPMNAPGNAIEAGLVIDLKGDGCRGAGRIYILSAYMPDGLDWLAAEIECALEMTEFDHGDFGVPDYLRDLAFERRQYVVECDHEHCDVCMTTICSAPDAHSVGEGMVAMTAEGYEVWLCPACFERHAESRNLSLAK